ncbi:MAG: hypothetical protein JSR37_01125 [Verrucomicrobia bacterium]|nr:hypothetical protein [Verrucomicrobiota bacterium]MBS0637607.1 hypothetical protein [Verrucomicrobiota bacterium]
MTCSAILSSSQSSYQNQQEGWECFVKDPAFIRGCSILCRPSSSNEELNTAFRLLDKPKLIQALLLWPKVTLTGKCYSPFVSRVATYLRENISLSDYLLHYFLFKYPPEQLHEYLDQESWPFDTQFTTDAHNYCTAAGLDFDASYPLPGKGDLVLYYAAALRKGRYSDFTTQDFYEVKSHIESATTDLDIRRKMWKLLFYVHVDLEKRQESPFIQETIKIICSNDEIGMLAPMYVAFLSFSKEIDWGIKPLKIRCGHDQIEVTNPCPFTRLVLITRKMRQTDSALLLQQNWWRDPVSKLWAMKIEDFLFPSSIITKSFLSTLEICNAPATFWGATCRYAVEVAVGERTPLKGNRLPTDEILFDTKSDLKFMLIIAICTNSATFEPSMSSHEQVAFLAKKLIKPQNISELVDFIFDQKPIQNLGPWLELNRQFKSADEDFYQSTHDLQ